MSTQPKPNETHLDSTEAEEEIARLDRTFEDDRKQATDARETITELRKILPQPVPH